MIKKRKERKRREVHAAVAEKLVALLGDDKLRLKVPACLESPTCVHCAANC